MPPTQPTSPPPLPPTQTLYSILNLPTPTSRTAPSQTLTTSQIKAAYRRALLKHHPDKTHPTHLPASTSNLLAKPHINGIVDTTTSEAHSNASSPSIDAITYARDILSNPAHRRAYDQQLLTARYAPTELSGQNQGATVSYSETIDLDDMRFEEGPSETEGQEGGGRWRWGCRCENEEGFVLTEGELMDAAEGDRDGAAGEVVVGCRGCSLVVRVLFCAVDDEDEGEEKEEGSQEVVNSEDKGQDTEHGSLKSNLAATATATVV